MDNISARISAVLIAGLMVFVPPPQDDSGVGKTVDLGTHRLHYYSAGQGEICVVLDVGIGESYKDWLPLLENISSRIRMVCYDRAGYGESERGPFPRNADRAADELERLLKKANIRGPYLLVGHSLGAMNLQVFAHKNREGIKGMLLLDPPPLDWLTGKEFPGLKEMAEEQTRIFEKTAESILSEGTEGRKKQADFFLTLASEHREMFSSSPASLRAISSFEDIPMIVIASGKSNPAFGEEAARFQLFWNGQCKKLAGKSSRGKYWLASRSTHHIHRDDPQLVLKAIYELAGMKGMTAGDDFFENASDDPDYFFFMTQNKLD